MKVLLVVGLLLLVVFGLYSLAQGDYVEPGAAAEVLGCCLIDNQFMTDIDSKTCLGRGGEFKTCYGRES